MRNKEWDQEQEDYWIYIHSDGYAETHTNHEY